MRNEVRMPAGEPCSRWAVRPIFDGHMAQVKERCDVLVVSVAVADEGLVRVVERSACAVAEPGLDGRRGVAVGVLAGHAALVIRLMRDLSRLNRRASSSSE